MSDLPRVFEFHRACEKVNNNHLRPCPFCGGEAFIANCFDNSSDVGYYVVCKNDNCQGEGNWEYRGAQGAIESWNNRPLEDALQAKLDIAMDALKKAHQQSGSNPRLYNVTYPALKKLEEK